MPITNVILRHSKKGEVETTIIEFHLSERERPYSLYVNNFTDIEGLKNQLSGLAHIIPPVEAAEQERVPDAAESRPLKWSEQDYSDLRLHGVGE